MHQMLGVVPMATRRESRENVVVRVELACEVESNRVASNIVSAREMACKQRN